MMTNFGPSILGVYVSLSISVISSIGSGILLISLLYLSLQILGKKIRFHLAVEIGIFLATISSILVFIDFFSQFSQILLLGKIILPMHAPMIGLQILFIAFPLLFIFYLAWIEKISVVTRYGIILGYIFFIILLSSIGFVVFMEQFIFDKKVCLGFSCPIKGPGEFTK